VDRHGEGEAVYLKGELQIGGRDVRRALAVEARAPARVAHALEERRQRRRLATYHRSSTSTRRH
jgi:hypothetical protein